MIRGIGTLATDRIHDVEALLKFFFLAHLIVLGLLGRLLLLNECTELRQFNLGWLLLVWVVVKPID